jgi:antitoxin HicB
MIAMQSFSYPLHLSPEPKGRLTVRFRDLPEAITSGVGKADALRQAVDCLEESIAGRIADGLTIPRPSKARKGELMATLPAGMAAKGALYLAVRDQKITNAQLARRLRVDEKEVRRMLDPRHATKLARIEEALTLLGRRLVLTVEAA